MESAHGLPAITVTTSALVHLVRSPFLRQSTARRKRAVTIVEARVASFPSDWLSRMRGTFASRYWIRSGVAREKPAPQGERRLRHEGPALVGIDDDDHGISAAYLPVSRAQEPND
jgi:hypothetical protein